jgi:hypothetical protein
MLLNTSYRTQKLGKTFTMKNAVNNNRLFSQVNMSHDLSSDIHSIQNLGDEYFSYAIIDTAASGLLTSATDPSSNLLPYNFKIHNKVNIAYARRAFSPFFAHLNRTPPMMRTRAPTQVHNYVPGHTDRNPGMKMPHNNPVLQNPSSADLLTEVVDAA